MVVRRLHHASCRIEGQLVDSRMVFPHRPHKDRTNMMWARGYKEESLPRHPTYLREGDISNGGT